MPEYLVISIGNYPEEQLREEQGCPATQAKVVEATDEGSAIADCREVFEAFGPVERCIAIPYSPIELVLVDTDPVFVDPADVPEPKPEPPNPDVQQEGFFTRPVPEDTEPAITDE